MSKPRTRTPSENHIDYWDGHRFVPWCQFENVTCGALTWPPGSLPPTHKLARDESGELCADCLALALEDLT